eukprot:scaffold7350_cov233-Pinguiococcus_pyrenoidosus.AAC.3
MNFSAFWRHNFELHLSSTSRVTARQSPATRSAMQDEGCTDESASVTLVETHVRCSRERAPLAPLDHTHNALNLGLQRLPTVSKRRKRSSFGGRSTSKAQRKRLRIEKGYEPEPNQKPAKVGRPKKAQPMQSKMKTNYSERWGKERQKVFVELEKSLKNSRGRRRTPEEQQAAAHLFAKLGQENPCCTNEVLYARVEALLGFQRGSVRLFVDPKKGFCPNVIDKGKRGWGSERFDLDAKCKIKAEHRPVIEEFIMSTLSQKKTVTERKVRSFANSFLGLAVSRATVRRALHKWGYEYGAQRKKKVQLTEKRKSQMRRFLTEYSQVASDPSFVVAMTDESYIHNSHRSNYSFQKGGAELQTVSKGARICILHAITEEGPVLVLPEHSELSAESAPRAYEFTGRERRRLQVISENAKLTSELFFPARKVGDYHDNMNSTRFMAWLREHFVPSFSARFPGKKPALVMDNASYHWCSEMSEVLAAATTKRDFYNILVSEGAKSIKVPRGEDMVVMEVTEDLLKVGGRKHRCIPTALELKSATMTWLHAHRPEKMKSKAVVEIERLGGKVIWLPPYCPFFNPIETYWAVGKNRAADAFDCGRTSEDVIEDVRRGWYGDDQVDAVNCAGLFRAAHAEMDRRISFLDGISGSFCSVRVDGDAEIEELEASVVDAWEADLESDSEGEEDECDAADELDDADAPEDLSLLARFEYCPALAEWQRRGA